LARDPNPDAVWSALTVRAAVPAPAAKEEVWQAIFVDRTVPPSAFAAIGRAFWQPAQETALRPYPDHFLAELAHPRLAHTTTAIAILRHFFPRHGIDAGFPDRATAAAADPKISPSAAARLRAGADTVARMLRARAM
jgi:hypothetical protein